MFLVKVTKMKNTYLPRLRFNTDETLSEQIYRFLRKQIIIGRIEANTSISENDLANHFDVSRYPVREALNKLNFNGLIKVIPQKGTFVSKISIHNVSEICFIRCAIETTSIRFIKHLDKKDRNKIVKQLFKNINLQKKLLEQTDVNDKFLTLDDEFHQLLCQFSNTTLAWEVLETVKCNLDRVRYLSINKQSQMENLYKDHENIVNKINDESYEEACLLVEKHAFEITKTYEEIIKQNANFFDLLNCDR